MNKNNLWFNKGKKAGSHFGSFAGFVTFPCLVLSIYFTLHLQLNLIIILFSSLIISNYFLSLKPFLEGEKIVWYRMFFFYKLKQVAEIKVLDLDLLPHDSGVTMGGEYWSVLDSKQNRRPIQYIRGGDGQLE